MPPRTPGKHALLFIFLTVLLDSVGLGIIIPVTPELIMELTGEGLSKAATYGGWMLFLYAAVQFSSAPLIGNLSDRFGRRLVLLLSLFAFGCDYLLMGFAPTLGWLFVGRFIAGIAGATYSPAYAYIADISSPEERAQNFGLIGAAFGFGFILGPVIGGLLGDFGPRIPFFVAAGIAFLNLVYGYFVLPESLPPEQRRPFRLARANPLGTLLELRKYPSLLGALGVMFLCYMAHHVCPATWSYFTIERFEWSERQIGYSLGAIGLAMAFSQGYLTRILIPRIGSRRAAIVGLVAAAVAYVGFAFASAGWMLYAWLTLWAFVGLTAPSIQGILSNQIPADAQGELQGGLASLGSLAAIVAPPVMTQLFGFFTSEAAPVYLPGAAFLLAAGLLVIALVLFVKAVPPDSAPP